MKRAIAAVALVLALSGCTGGTPITGQSSSAAPVDAAVVPTSVAITSDALGTEAKRLADAVQALISNSDLVHVDDHSQLVAAAGTAPSYYGVLRTITISPGTDPVILAQSMAGIIKSSGWAQAQTTNDNGVFLTALGRDDWLLLLGGDSSIEGQSVITLQLASPDLP